MRMRGIMGLTQNLSRASCQSEKRSAEACVRRRRLPVRGEEERKGQRGRLARSSQGRWSLWGRGNARATPWPLEVGAAGLWSGEGRFWVYLPSFRF